MGRKNVIVTTHPLSAAKMSPTNQMRESGARCAVRNTTQTQSSHCTWRALLPHQHPSLQKTSSSSRRVFQLSQRSSQRSSLRTLPACSPLLGRSPCLHRTTTHLAKSLPPP